MATFSAAICVQPPQEVQQYGLSPRPLKAWQMATIEWGPGQVTGFVNKTAALTGVPQAIVIDPARIAPDGMKRPKREGGIESGVVPMKTARVKFQDKTRSLSRLIAEKRANGVGLRGKVLRLYEWQEGAQVDLERDLVGTYRLDDRGWIDGYRSLSGLDIRRQLKEKIFEPESYRLVQSISDGAVVMRIQADYDLTAQALPTLKHDARYSSNPNEDVIYFKMPTGEIIKAPKQGIFPVANTPNQVQLLNLERGALNTKHLIKGVTVDGDLEDDNLPELTEWQYLEETLPNFISMITTGVSICDERYMPAHHTIKMDPQWLDVDSLNYAAPELASLPLRAENFGSTTVKDLIEKEILPFLPATMQVNAAGQIQLRRITTIKEVGPDRHRFDQNVIDRNSLSEVKTHVSHIRSGIGIKAGWDARTERFGTPIFFADAGSQAANDDTNDAEVLVLESKLLHSSIHTNAQIRRLLPALAEHYLGEKLVFNLKVKPTAGVVDVGQRAHVYLKDVPDDAALSVLAPDINRSFLVTSIDPAADGTAYQFTGTSGLAADYFDTLTAPSLDIEEYTRNAEPLENALPPGALVEINGVHYLQPGTYELSFRTKYVFTLGPLYHTAGSTIVCAPGEEGPMFQCWVPHAWHSDSPTTVITTGEGGRSGGLPGKAGYAGFAVATTGTGSMSASAYYDKSGGGDTQITGWALSARPGVQAESYSTGDVPSISLSYNDGALVGLPANLSGYSGCGGGSTTITAKTPGGIPAATTVEGGIGAPNSAGVMIICQGATMAPAARFVVNGTDGLTPVSISTPGGAQDFSSGSFYNQAGSGAGPGTVLIGIDGPFPAIDLAAHVDAYPGQTFYNGTQMASPNVIRTQNIDKHSHFKAMPHTVNLASICSRVLYMPARATVQEKPLTGTFSSLAISRQEDGLIRLIPTDYVITSTLFPSDGSPGDIAVWEADLAGTNETPPAWIMNDNYQWVQLDWATAARDYFDKILLYRKTGGTISILSDTRPVGYPAGTHWLNSSDGTEWILGATAAQDKPFRDQGVPVGDELIANGNFAEGSKNWIFTRNSSLAPINVLSVLANEIAQAFITQGLLEGEFGDPESVVITNQNVLPVVSMSAASTSPTEITVNWTQQSDTTGIAGVEVRLDGVAQSGVSGSSHVITGLSPVTTYQVTVYNRGTNGNLSGPQSKNVTTSSEGSTGQLGIVFTNTGSPLTTPGRRVAGSAYQNDSSIVIEVGRTITLTLFDGSTYTSTVQADGAFEFNVPTTADANLNKTAAVYTNNGNDSSRAQAEFIYET